MGGYPDLHNYLLGRRVSCLCIGDMEAFFEAVGIVIEVVWSLAPRLLACCLSSVAIIIFVAWLGPPCSWKPLALLLVGFAGLIAGICWEIYGRRKNNRQP